MPTYIIKFPDQTHLTKPEPCLYGNYLSDHKYSQFDRSIAQQFTSLEDATIVADIVGGKVTTLETYEKFEEGKTYLTIGGDEFFVEAIVGNCVRNEKGSHRYNRQDSIGWCNGRTTGSKWTEKCLRYPPEAVVK
tara:strand:- start:56248 stop:56649 length:402 start_codon:yes stop_codon:yes gene_type:complete